MLYGRLEAVGRSKIMKLQIGRILECIFSESRCGILRKVTIVVTVVIRIVSYRHHGHQPYSHKQISVCEKILYWDPYYPFFHISQDALSIKKIAMSKKSELEQCRSKRGRGGKRAMPAVRMSAMFANLEYESDSGSAPSPPTTQVVVSVSFPRAFPFLSQVCRFSSLAARGRNVTMFMR